jgi:hypothetical protein
MTDPEDLLRDVVVGDRSEGDSEFQRAVQQQPELLDRLRRLRALTDRLDAAGAQQRAVLGAPAPAAGTDLPRAAIPVVRRPRRRFWLAAAAVAIAGMLWWWTLRDRPVDAPNSDVRLGPGDWVLSASAAPSGVTLSWHDPERPLTAAEHYQLRVFASATEAEPSTTLEAGTEPTWVLTPEQLRSLPNPFWFEVDVVGWSGSSRRSKLSAPVRH